MRKRAREDVCGDESRRYVPSKQRFMALLLECDHECGRYDEQIVT